LADALDPVQSRQFLASVREVIHKTALAMPTHRQFIDRHCAAGRVEAL
jgi:hypothetical protein